MRRILRIALPLLLVLIAGVVFAKEHRPDSEIVAELQDKLYHAQVFKHGNVTVSFENGVATLRGTVDSVGVKTDAERAGRKVDDVMQVVNDIQVHAEDVSPSQIVAQARHDILTYYAYTIFDNITLEVDGNTLVVNGQVTQPYKKSDIGNFLAHIKGVANLENKLQVLPVSNFDDELRIEIARAIYNDPYFIHYADQALPPIHIIVHNGNVTLDGVVANAMDRAKADSDARLAGTYFNFTDNLRVEGK
jgi:hyperosmotically inducible protein